MVEALNSAFDEFKGSLRDQLIDPADGEPETPIIPAGVEPEGQREREVILSEIAASDDLFVPGRLAELLN